MLNPTYGDGALLLDEKLGEISRDECKKMAKQFLAVASMKVSDDKSQEIYKKWFSPGFKGTTPTRAGYRLGFEVVRDIAKTTYINEMVKWNLKELHNNVLESLTNISR